jgi:hypothetical protein
MDNQRQTTQAFITKLILYTFLLTAGLEVLKMLHTPADSNQTELPQHHAAEVDRAEYNSHKHDVPAPTRTDSHDNYEPGVYQDGSKAGGMQRIHIEFCGS